MPHMLLRSTYYGLTSCTKSKKSNEAFLRYFPKNYDFRANFDLSVPFPWQQEFSKKIRPCHFSVRYGPITSCKKSEKSDERFSGKSVNGRTETDKHYYGPTDGQTLFLWTKFPVPGGPYNAKKPLLI